MQMYKVRIAENGFFQYIEKKNYILLSNKLYLQGTDTLDTLGARIQHCQGLKNYMAMLIRLVIK